MVYEGYVREDHVNYTIGNKESVKEAWSPIWYGIGSEITGDTTLRVKFSALSKKLSRRNSDAKLLVPVKSVFNNVFLHRRYLDKEGRVYVCDSLNIKEKKGFSMKNFKTGKVRKMNFTGISEWDQFYEKVLIQKNNPIFEAYLDIDIDERGRPESCDEGKELLKDLVTRAGYEKGEKVELKRSLKYDRIYFEGKIYPKHVSVSDALRMAFLYSRYEDKQGRTYKNNQDFEENFRNIHLINLRGSDKKVCPIKDIFSWDQIFEEKLDLED